MSWWCAWWCPRVARGISAQAAIGRTAAFVCQDKQGTGHEQGQEDGQSALGRHLWTGAGTTVSTTTTSLHTPMEEIQLKTHLIWISPPLSLRRCAQQVFETQHQFLLASSQDGWSWNTWLCLFFNVQQKGPRALPCPPLIWGIYYYYLGAHKSVILANSYMALVGVMTE